MNEVSRTCPLHSGFKTDIENLKGKLKSTCRDNDRLWEAVDERSKQEDLRIVENKVDNKVSMKLFLGILALIGIFMIGISGTQLYLVEKVAHIEEKTESTYDLMKNCFAADATISIKGKK